MYDIPRPLLDDIAEGKCLPFIGAGFSLNAEVPDGGVVPDWKGLAQILADSANVSIALPGPQAASAFQQKFGRVQLIESIRRALRVDEITPGRAHREFADLPFDTVYTTNFDLLLEDACVQTNKPCRSLVGELQIPFHGGPLTTNVVKMHGDLRHEEHIVVTQDDYDQFTSRYPVIATHLSAMLITRTPLFVGYSLTDPDFLQIREVVRSRLGPFERMAYVIQFDAGQQEVEEGYRHHLHIVSLKTGKTTPRGAALANFFNSVRKALDARGVTRLRSARPDVFEPLTAVQVNAAVRSKDAPSVLASSSNLCYAMLPFRPEMDIPFDRLIRPVVERVGLSVIRADQFSATTVITEQIRWAIQQAQLCIAVVDGGNPNVLYEAGIAESLGKPTILLAEHMSDIPFEFRNRHILRYDAQRPEACQADLERAINAIFGTVQLSEAAALLRDGSLLAATATYAIVLERALKRVLQSYQENAMFKGVVHVHMTKTLNMLAEAQVIASEHVGDIRKCIAIRNRTIHAVRQPSLHDAKFMADCVTKFVTEYLGPQDFAA